VPRRFHELSAEPLYQRIYATVDAIPRGRVATYGGVARAAGLGRRARAVGRALACLPLGSPLPWHRVVNARGEISPRGDGEAARAQRRRLEREGVRFDARGRIDLARYAWRESAGAGEAASDASRAR
jgi:methylated-DNA-protein-cysteine methyltransferase-like protein